MKIPFLQLIKGLEAARGNGTSMISLIMPPKDQVRATFEKPLQLLETCTACLIWCNICKSLLLKLITTKRSKAVARAGVTSTEDVG